MSKATRKLKVNDRLEILWHDAHDCGEEGRSWHDRESLSMDASAFKVLSIGYFLKQENGFIYIAGDLIQTMVGRPTAIPISCVKAVKKL